MDILIFFSFLFSILHAAAAAAEPCSITMCGKNEVPIRFPFHQQGKQPQSCGYPGFYLGCDTQNMIHLKLPYSGDFFVRRINYLDQLIHLYDPDGCLPRRLLSFNLSGSPFVAVFHHNYTFLSCPTQVMRSRFTSTIGCLSNSTHSVLATSSIELAKRMASSSCRIITTVPIPVSWPAESDEDYTAELDADIQLTWHAPHCGECEEQGGTCGLKDKTSKEIDCFHLPKSSGSLTVFRIICLSISVPALSCAVGMAVYACCHDDNRHQARQNPREQNGPAAVSPQRMVGVTGLDESTIESFEKMVLGESRRIPGPNDGTCPICLSEYLSKDTIRCIPKCKHCFHAECIDEWLRMNTTCPVCRNKPSAGDTNSHIDPV
ncbi:hypothetical protein V6N11_041728 [Hibiscus sabdariffa]|uniref:RING-type domain-containing protein n=1 Tax=Hibiscus sabdariffa TaxID=183260 RepID=A0ABR2RLJ8_9ROSI